LVCCLAKLPFSPPHFFSSMLPQFLLSTLFPYTTLFRSPWARRSIRPGGGRPRRRARLRGSRRVGRPREARRRTPADRLRPRVCRSEEHTSELQSRFDLVCRLLLEKKKHHQ